MPKKVKPLGFGGVRITFHGISLDVQIIGARQAYGRYEFLVKPLAGAGQAWVSSTNVVKVRKAAR
jgi:hypothetical protein